MAITDKYAPTGSILREDDEGNALAGLPGPLPRGEHMVWQGRPDVFMFAKQVFHTRLVVLYFAVFALWGIVSVVQSGQGVLDAVMSAVSALAAGAVVLGLFGLLAWLGARATVYTITTERIVMQIGSALPKTINIPFSAVDAVHLSERRGGFGNISIQLIPGPRFAYFFLWPHVRAWHLRHPQPMLRAVPVANEAARILVRSIENSARLKAPSVVLGEEIESNDIDRPCEPSPFRVPLIASAALCLAVLITVAVIQFDKFQSGGLGPKTPEVVHELNFRKLGEDRLAIVDAQRNVTLATLGSGGDGLVRGAVRGLERARKLNKVPSSAPYHLAVWQNGRITLSDLSTNRHFPLSSFGATDSDALKALLSLGGRDGP